MKTLNTSLLVKTGLSLFGLAAGIALPTVTSSAFAQTDKMAQISKMGGSSLGSGQFIQITHATKGQATLSVAGNKRTVSLSNFQTSMGPQLRVYLVPGAVKTNAEVKALVASKKFVDLGALKSIKGNQNYTLPAGSKLGKGASVIVWCDKFDVVFGAAALS